MFNQTEYNDHRTELTFRLTDAPTAQERVLDMLLLGAGEGMTEAAIREVLELPKTTVHVALASLVAQGVATEERVGRTGLYAVDLDDPLVRTLKTAQAVRRVQLAIAGVREQLDLVILFGSASRGQDTPRSDVDVFVVAADTETVLAELAQNQWLQPVVMTSEAHMRLIAEGGTFASEIARGITIWERR